MTSKRFVFILWGAFYHIEGIYESLEGLKKSHPKIEWDDSRTSLDGEWTVERYEVHP